jgi:hypothetical protein
MGLLKGTLSFSRYRFPGKMPKNFREFVDRQIKLHAFREGSLGAEEKSLGWTSIENVLDTNFAQSDYLYGDYLAISLRLDRKVDPPSLLKLKMLEAERKFLSARKRLSKEQRDEIREQIRLELLSKAHPVPSFFDVCWSLSENWLLFGSLTAKVMEEFETLFKKTFDGTLYASVPWDVRPLDAKLAEQVSALKAGIFLEPGAVEDSAAAPFLGREFLTWLWFKSEERGGAISLPEVGDVETAFMRRLVLESGDGEYSETVVCQGLHADLKEGKAALREGKKVKEARLQLGKGTDQWEFTLKADQFQIQSMKLPSGLSFSEEGEQKEGRLLERIGLVENALKTLDQLFSLFLARRLSPAWSSEEIPRLRKWVQK